MTQWTTLAFKGIRQVRSHKHGVWFFVAYDIGFPTLRPLYNRKAFPWTPQQGTLAKVPQKAGIWSTAWWGSELRLKLEGWRPGQTRWAIFLIFGGDSLQFYGLIPSSIEVNNFGGLVPNQRPAQNVGSNGCDSELTLWFKTSGRLARSTMWQLQQQS